MGRPFGIRRRSSLAILVLAGIALLVFKIAAGRWPLLAQAQPIELGISTTSSFDVPADAGWGVSRAVFRTWQHYGRSHTWSPSKISALADELCRRGVDAWSARRTVQAIFPSRRLIWPIDIADAAIATLFFLLLALAVPKLSRSNTFRGTRIPDAGPMLFLATMFLILGPVYLAYANVMPPLLGSYAFLYDWLAVGAAMILLIAMGIVTYRNVGVLERFEFLGPDGGASPTRD